MFLPANLRALLHKITAVAGFRLTILLGIPVLVAILSLLVCSCVDCTHSIDTMPSIFKTLALAASLQLSQLATAQKAFASSATAGECMLFT